MAAKLPKFYFSVYGTIEDVSNAIDDFKANVLAFFVTIKPQDHKIAPSCFSLEKRWHLKVCRRFFFQSLSAEQLGLI
jgi:hypothetical protein